MGTFLIFCGGLSCAIWVYLIFLNGGFWLSREVLPLAKEEIDWPDVAVVIPARNEAETIETVVNAHLANAYRGGMDVIVVDDQSDDGTGDIVRKIGAPNVYVVEGTPLPEGWSGKLWAVHNGLHAARTLSPNAQYVLLTDADIEHAPGTMDKLAHQAITSDRALVSIMAHLDSRGFWGGLLMPAFIFFFQKLYPFPSTNNPKSAVAGAAGGCMFINRAVLDEIGGVESMRGNLIDDCSLAHAIKDPSGKKRRIWLGFDKGVVSLRDNRELSTIWKMVARTAFTQLRYSPVLLVGAALGMIMTYVIGPFLFFTLPLHGSGLAFTLGTWAWLGSMVAYGPTLLRYKKSPVWALLLPFTAAVYLAMTVSSALNHWKGKGGNWKGRTYS